LYSLPCCTGSPCCLIHIYYICTLICLLPNFWFGKSITHCKFPKSSTPASARPTGAIPTGCVGLLCQLLAITANGAKYALFWKDPNTQSQIVRRLGGERFGTENYSSVGFPGESALLYATAWQFRSRPDAWSRCKPLIPPPDTSFPCWTPSYELRQT